MPSTYSPDLRIELIANGEKSGTWGTITNSNLGTLVEDAISGLANVPIISTDQALTVFDGVYDQARNAAINLTTVLTNDFNVYVPPVTKLYVIINSSSYNATIYASSVAGNTTPAGLGVTVPANSSCLLRSNGTNIYEQLNTIVGDLRVFGNLSFSNPIGPSSGGTGVTTLTGVAYGNGTSAFTAATGAQIVAAIGSTPVQKSNAVSNTGGWNITPSGTTLYLNYNGTNVGKLDSSGNLTVAGNVTAFGTV